MKKIYSFLKILIGSCIGVFIGSALYQYYQYKRYPLIYEIQSAPWYTSILFKGVITIVVVIIVLILMKIIKKKL